jgi:hypothetical protein
MARPQSATPSRSPRKSGKLSCEEKRQLVRLQASFDRARNQTSLASDAGLWNPAEKEAAGARVVVPSPVRSAAAAAAGTPVQATAEARATLRPLSSPPARKLTPPPKRPAVKKPARAFVGAGEVAPTSAELATKLDRLVARRCSQATPPRDAGATPAAAAGTDGGPPATAHHSPPVPAARHKGPLRRPEAPAMDAETAAAFGLSFGLAATPKVLDAVPAQRWLPVEGPTMLPEILTPAAPKDVATAAAALAAPDLADPEDSLNSSKSLPPPPPQPPQPEDASVGSDARAPSLACEGAPLSFVAAAAEGDAGADATTAAEDDVAAAFEHLGHGGGAATKGCYRTLKTISGKSVAEHCAMCCPGLFIGDIEAAVSADMLTACGVTVSSHKPRFFVSVTFRPCSSLSQPIICFL